METINYKGYTIQIKHDSYAENPLTEWGCTGDIAYLDTSRYVLGNKALSNKEMNHIENNTREYIAIPVYAYVHSGSTVRASETGNPFHCPWDSGRSGIVYISRKKAREEFGYGRITKQREQEIKKALKATVEVFNDYLTGNVYGYEIAETGDSCWGFFGDPEKSGVIEEAKSIVDCSLEQQCEDV